MTYNELAERVWTSSNHIATADCTGGGLEGRAPQRGDRCMGKRLCMRLPLIFGGHPTPGLDGADDGLRAGMNVNVPDEAGGLAPRD